MSKCRNIIFAIILMIGAVIGVINISATEVQADSTYHIVTFNYNTSRILQYIPENTEVQNSLKNYSQSVTHGEYAEETSKPSSLINDYYTYKWTVDGNVVDINTYAITEDTMFVAQWTARPYYVTFKFESSEMKSKVTNLQTRISFTVESPQIILYTPNVPHYRFLGWYDPSDPMSQLDVPANSIGDKEFTAKFEPVEYTIDYNTDISGVVDPITYTIEDEDITLHNPVLEGHIFKGWYSDKNYTNKITTIDCSAGGNLEIYPLWDLEVYNVTYILPDGSISIVETEYGKTAELPDMDKSIFEIVKTDVSRKNITGDTVIRISTVNIWYVYVIALVVIVGVIVLIVVMRKKRHNTHNKLRQIYHSNTTKKNTRKY